MHFSKQDEIKCSPERTAMGSGARRPHAAHVRYKFLWSLEGHTTRSGSLNGGLCDLQSYDTRPLLSIIQPNIPIQSLAPQRFKDNCTQGLCSALQGSLEAARLKSG